MSLLVITSETACPAVSSSSFSVVFSGASGASFAMVTTTGSDQILATPIASTETLSQLSSSATPFVTGSFLPSTAKLNSEASSTTSANTSGVSSLDSSTTVPGASITPLPAGNLVSPSPTDATTQSQTTLSTSPTSTGGGGPLSVTVSPLVPLVDGSSQQDGTLLTYTQATASSTGSSAAAIPTSNSLFENHGAVAATFVVVGMVGATFAGCLYLIWRRRRRRRQDKWDKSRPSIIWPVRKSTNTSAVDQVTINNVRLSIVSTTTSASLHGTDSRNMAVARATSTNSAGLAGIGAVNRTVMAHNSAEITTRMSTMVDSLATSSILSTPSMYSMTPPPMDFDGEAREAKASSVLLPQVPSTPPPRPPRRLRPPLTVGDITALAARVANIATPSPIGSNTANSPPPLPHHLRPAKAIDDAKVRTSMYAVV